MPKLLRGGYTTGACVAAGAKAAAMLSLGTEVDVVHIAALDGTILDIPVKNVRKISGGIQAEVIKDAGDDPDITNGTAILTTLILLKDGAGIRYEAGEGVGQVTKPGLSVSPGQPAINPGPRELIAKSLTEVFGYEPDCVVRIDIPEGKKLAKISLISSFSAVFVTIFLISFEGTLQIVKARDIFSKTVRVSNKLKS